MSFNANSRYIERKFQVYHKHNTHHKATLKNIVSNQCNPRKDTDKHELQVSLCKKFLSYQCLKDVDHVKNIRKKLHLSSWTITQNIDPTSSTTVEIIR